MSFILVLLFSFNNVTSPEFTQGFSAQEPIQLAEKIDTRRRGLRGSGCGNPPDVWAISMCETDFFCYADPNEVSLWLPLVKRTEGANFVTIKNLETQQEITKRWQVSDITIPWPIEEVPITTETKYIIRLSNRNGSKSFSVILNMIPTELLELTKRLEWMKEKGCTQQTEIILDEQDV